MAGVKTMLGLTANASMVSTVKTMVMTGATSVATAAQWAWNAAMTANPIGLIIAGVAALVAALVWVSSKTEGWGNAWNHTVKGAKLLFSAFVLGAQANFSLLTNGFMIGISKIQASWYKFKNALGIGDKNANLKEIARLNDDVEKRKEAIKAGYKKADETSRAAAQEFKEAFNSVKWKKSADKESSVDIKKNPVAADAKGLNLKGLNDTTKGMGKATAGGTTTGSGDNAVGKSIVQNLTVNNHFGVDGSMNIRKIADEVTGLIIDRLRDGVIQIG